MTASDPELGKFGITARLFRLVSDYAERSAVDFAQAVYRQ
jgi:hypothetical protein